MPGRFRILTSSYFNVHEKESQSSNSSAGIRCWGRVFVTILLFFGFINISILRINFNNGIDSLPAFNQMSTEDFSGPSWCRYDGAMYVFGKFFSLIGGYLTIKYGGTYVFGFSMFLNAVQTILVPAIPFFNFKIIFLLQALKGLFESFSYVSFLEVVFRWFPVKERARAIFQCLSATLICDGMTNVYNGIDPTLWKSVVSFYVTSGFALLWCSIWFIFITNEPASNDWISRKELILIENDGNEVPRKEILNNLQWKSIIFSRSVWSLCITRCLCVFVVSLFQMRFDYIIRLDKTLNESGRYVHICNLLVTFFLLISCQLIDRIPKKFNKWTVTRIYKSVIGSEFTLGIICLIVAIFATDNFLLFWVIVIQSTLKFDSLFMHIVPLYIAPQQSSLIAGISEFWASISIFLAPFVDIYGLNEVSSISGFTLCGIIISISCLIFILFGTCEIQSWSRVSVNNSNESHIINNCKGDPEEKCVQTSC